jgi:hypothetical protein
MQLMNRTHELAGCVSVTFHSSQHPSLTLVWFIFVVAVLLGFWGFFVCFCFLETGSHYVTEGGLVAHYVAWVGLKLVTSCLCLLSAIIHKSLKKVYVEVCIIIFRNFNH